MLSLPAQPTSEESVRVITEKGYKEFEFDRTFAPTDGQPQVRDSLITVLLT